MSVFVYLCVVLSRESSDVKSEREKREERPNGHEIWEYAWRFLVFFPSVLRKQVEIKTGEAARGCRMDRFMQIFSYYS